MVQPQFFWSKNRTNSIFSQISGRTIHNPRYLVTKKNSTERLQRSFWVKCWRKFSSPRCRCPPILLGCRETPAANAAVCWGHILGPFTVSAWHCQAAPQITGGAPPKVSVSTIQQASIYSTCKLSQIYGYTYDAVASVSAVCCWNIGFVSKWKIQDPFGRLSYWP